LIDQLFVNTLSRISLLEIVAEIRMNSLSLLLKRITKEAVESVAVSRAIKDEKGVTAIEYGLIAALIAVAAVVVMGTVGTDLSGVFSQVAASL
jgi:pilus assembly protein Flp/PilA